MVLCSILNTTIILPIFATVMIRRNGMEFLSLHRKQIKKGIESTRNLFDTVLFWGRYFVAVDIYKAAILSNKQSKLLFEEPEARIYPLSVINVVQSVINLTNNQFFITTHSPYIIDALLEQLNDEVAIYFVDMKSGNTTV